MKDFIEELQEILQNRRYGLDYELNKVVEMRRVRLQRASFDLCTVELNEKLRKVIFEEVQFYSRIDNDQSGKGRYKIGGLNKYRQLKVFY